MTYLVAGDNWLKPTHFTRSVTRDQLFQHVRDKCIAAAEALVEASIRLGNKQAGVK